MPDPLAIASPTSLYGGTEYIFAFEPNGSSAPLKVTGPVTITYKTGSIYLVQFQANHGGLASVQTTLMNTASGAGQDFKIDVDQDNTNLSAASPGGVLALAAVNTTTGARGDIAADAKCRVFVRVTFTENTTFQPSAGP
jgi:predicted small secreted protein